MKTSVGLVAVMLVGCTQSDPQSDPPVVLLEEDAHFVAVFAPHATPEDCLANAQEPRGCRFSLSLCKNGRVGRRIADIVDDGVYEMDGSVARASFTHGGSLDFDVEAVIDLDDPSTDWIVDTARRWETLQFDNIDCSRP